MKRILATVLMTLALAPLAFAKDEMTAKAESLRTAIGAPTGKERTTAGGGKVQEFEKGAIYWSPKTGARLVKSDVLLTYKKAGGEAGKLGYPVTDERSTGKGMRQTFEHGFIASTSTGDLQPLILPGANLTASSINLDNIPGLGLSPDDNGGVILQNLSVSAPEIDLSCGCELNPSPGPQRLGFCTVTISRDRKTARCKVQNCNGSCVFSN